MLASFLTTRRLLAVSGADAESFLQSIVSQDVAKVTAEQSLWSALLSPQGRFMADFVMMRTADGVLLDVDARFAEELFKKLRMYRLRAQVELSFLPENYSVAALWGGEMAAFGLQGHATGFTKKQEDGVLALLDVRSVAMGARLVGECEAVAKQLRALGAQEQPEEAYHRHRLMLGIPEGAQDAVVDRSLLLELGYDVLGAVSFTKGCYVGQEVTARSKHRAQLRKGLMCVRALDGTTLPDVGALLMSGEDEVGEMRSHVGYVGLALMRLDAPLEDVMVAGVRVDVSQPSWMQCP